MPWLLLLFWVAGCGSETTRGRAGDRAWEPALDAAPSDSAEPPLEQASAPETPGAATKLQLSIFVRANLPDAFVEPGAQPGAERYFNVSVEMESGELVMSGCVSSVPGSCYRTWRHFFTAEQAAEFDRRWAEVEARPRCEPDAILPGDREVEVSWASLSETFPWPRDASQMETRNQGPCRALPRLVWWLVGVGPTGTAHPAPPPSLFFKRGATGGQAQILARS